MECQFVNIHTHHPTGTVLEPTFVGVHPWQAGLRQGDEIIPLLEDADLVGEIGLDYACTADRELQLQLFREQLTLAERHAKPVVLHCVKAFEPVMQELSKHSLRAVIFHGFIGSPEQAAEAVKKGYYLSFGERTFSSPRTMKALRCTSVEKLFAETDERDMPIEEIYRRIADIKNLDPAELKCRIFHNYEEIFNR